MARTPTENSPSTQVAELEQTLRARCTTGCAFIVRDELDALLSYAKEGATMLERRGVLLATLEKMDRRKTK